MESRSWLQPGHTSHGMYTCIHIHTNNSRGTGGNNRLYDGSDGYRHPSDLKGNTDCESQDVASKENEKIPSSTRGVGTRLCGGVNGGDR